MVIHNGLPRKESCSFPFRPLGPVFSWNLVLLQSLLCMPSPVTLLLEAAQAGPDAGPSAGVEAGGLGGTAMCGLCAVYSRTQQES